MKHIVFLSAFVKPLRSGAEAMVEEVTSALSTKYRFTIIAARLKRSLPRSEQWGQNVQVVRIGFGFWFDKWLYPFLAPKYVRRLQPDIVHANLESFAGMALLRIAKKNPQLKTVLTNQNTYINYRGVFNTYNLIKRMHKAATVVTVLSNALLKRSHAMGRTDAVLIPNGVHVQVVPPYKPEFGRIVFAGRLEHIKGIDILLEAFAKLPVHAHLRIIGSGSLEQTLRLQASKLLIADRVTFVGQCTHAQVLEEFAQAEVFCGLSRSEAFGNVFVEALACGAAVVATNVDGIPDIVTSGHNGLLVAPDSVEESAEALCSLLDNPELRAQYSANGKQSVQTFDWSHIVAQYDEIYQRLL